MNVQLGEQVRIPPLVRRGMFSQADVDETHQRGVCVSWASGAELAAQAARKALGLDGGWHGQAPSPIDLHLHAAFGDAPDCWSAACYVLNQLALQRALCCQINATYNGMMVGLELAASMLAGRPDLDTALLTAGDRLTGPRLSRLDADFGVVYGDAGAAVVLDRRPGIAEVISSVTNTDPELGSAQLADADPGGGDRDRHQPETQPHKWTQAWLAATNSDAEDLLRRHGSGLTETVKSALTDAGIDIDEPRWVLGPFLGRRTVRQQFLAPLGIEEDRTLTQLGLHFGRLGAVDQIVGLRHLVATMAVQPGDFVLLVSFEVGISWTAAVLQITDPGAGPG